jgi:uncharacterized membrane-anchored protein
MNRSRAIFVAAAVLVQMVLVVVGVGPQLSARLTGAEYRFAVGPIDPIDPFRGAYVQLGYPGLPMDHSGVEGEAYIPLIRDGATGVWRGAGIQRLQPDRGPFLACHTEGYGAPRCGIEYLFLSEERAREVADELRTNTAVAIVRVDSRGNAAIVRLDVTSQ